MTWVIPPQLASWVLQPVGGAFGDKGLPLLVGPPYDKCLRPFGRAGEVKRGGSSCNLVTHLGADIRRGLVAMHLRTRQPGD